MEQKLSHGGDLFIPHGTINSKEIRDAGFLSLVPYFDKDGYAQTIAEYLIDYGTEHLSITLTSPAR